MEYYNNMYINRSQGLSNTITAAKLNLVFPEFTWTISGSTVTVTAKENFLPKLETLHTKQGNTKYTNITFNSTITIVDGKPRQTGTINNVTVGTTEWSLKCSGYMLDWYLNQSVTKNTDEPYVLYYTESDEISNNYKDENNYEFQLKFQRHNEYRMNEKGVINVKTKITQTNNTYRFNGQTDKIMLRPKIIFDNFTDSLIDDIQLPTLRDGEYLQLSVQAPVTNSDVVARPDLEYSTSYHDVAGNRYFDPISMFYKGDSLYHTFNLTVKANMPMPEHYDLADFAGTSISWENLKKAWKNKNKTYTVFDEDWANDFLIPKTYTWSGTQSNALVWDSAGAENWKSFTMYLFPGWNECKDRATVDIDPFTWQFKIEGQFLPTKKVYPSTITGEWHRGITYVTDKYDLITVDRFVLTESWFGITNSNVNPFKGLVNGFISFFGKNNAYQYYWPFQLTNWNSYQLSANSSGRWCMTYPDSIVDDELYQGYTSTVYFRNQIGLCFWPTSWYSNWENSQSSAWWFVIGTNGKGDYNYNIEEEVHYIIIHWTKDMPEETSE